MSHPIVVLSRQLGFRSGWTLELFHEPTFAVRLGAQTHACVDEGGGVLRISGQLVSGLGHEPLEGSAAEGWALPRGLTANVGQHELVWFQSDDDTTSVPLSTKTLAAVTNVRRSDTPHTRSVLADILEEEGALVEAEYVRLEMALQRKPDDFATKLVHFRTLGVMVGTTFRYLVGRDVEGCAGLRWTFRCPRSWDELTETRDPESRACSTCKQLVVRSTTEEHAAALGRRGICVSLRLPDIEELWEGEIAEPED